MNLLIVLVSFILPKLTLTVQSVTQDPDYGATIDKLIVSRGFDYEKHYIKTEDNYILGVYRLINPYIGQTLRSQLKPVVLQHGFLGSGADFFINAPGGDALPCQLADQTIIEPSQSVITNNLGFLLANLCYDVWISNSRGNRYSRNHTKYNPDKDTDYWKFTFDEMIIYDSPAIIDYILDATEFESLTWIGHSQGTMIMFALLAEKPHYSLKVAPFIALAPVAYLEYIEMSLKFAANVPGLLWVARQLPGELSDNNFILDAINKLACPKWDVGICDDLLYPTLGYNMAELNESRVEVYRSQGWPGSSIWNLVHFGQNVAKAEFRKFDYGKDENTKRYGGPVPPKYQIDQINSTSIALLYSKSDDLGDEKDVARLVRSLKVPLLRDYFVPEPTWNHKDFLYAKETYHYVNSIVIETLSDFHSKHPSKFESAHLYKTFTSNDLKCTVTNTDL